MTLRTAFTEQLGLRHPVALAPMGGSAGGALAAAVSNAGGLGLLGGGNGDRDWLTRELPIVAGGTRGPWGVGFQSWAVDRGTLELALEPRPSAVMLSFGDPRPLAEPARASGATLIIQVTSLDEARQAMDLGADVIVAQGTEAGGHGARRGWSTLAFVPVVADLAAPVPVLPAGGIADGRGVAAALALGAAGALVGTRLLATAEALADPAASSRRSRCGQPGDRPHHRPAAGGRGDRRPSRAGRGRAGPRTQPLARVRDRYCLCGSVSGSQASGQQIPRSPTSSVRASTAARTAARSSPRRQTRDHDQ
jgi:nitronate monooxygenase